MAKKLAKEARPGADGKVGTRQLSPEELGALAERMVKSKSPRKVAALKEEIIRGFYGHRPKA
ncbi:MAG: hypothetical protein Q7S40_08625 [Opitutaceae bacterium]|nr:hypothetical protein [Opitutaceae bacterium]